MYNQPFSIENFRKYLQENCIKKGVIPPLLQSKKEQELYNLYLKGYTHRQPKKI